ncbi:MAG: ABC transporter ATP-binding protein [Anaerolineae bacterium]
MIGIESLTFAYGRDRAPVFEGFSWQVAGGEAWSVTGPSGCGKTTLLYLISGLRRPQAGTVSVAGADAHLRVNRGRVGLVLQDYGLLPWATAWDNARLGLRVRRLKLHGRGLEGAEAAATEADVHHWMTRLGIEPLADRYPSQLSGGERQRVAIARALALRPRVLLLDEPFSALDAPTREGLEQLTVSLSVEADITTIFVTHSIEEAAMVGRRVLVLGTPPNRTATVIENRLVGEGRRQSQPEFGRICGEIRAALSAGARP